MAQPVLDLAFQTEPVDLLEVCCLDGVVDGALGEEGLGTGLAPLLDAAYATRRHTASLSSPGPRSMCAEPRA